MRTETEPMIRPASSRQTTASKPQFDLTFRQALHWVKLLCGWEATKRSSSPYWSGVKISAFMEHILNLIIRAAHRPGICQLIIAQIAPEGKKNLLFSRQSGRDVL